MTPIGNKLIEALPDLRKLGLDDHECIVFMKDLRPSIQIRRPDPHKADYVLDDANSVVGRYRLGATSELISLEINPSLKGEMDSFAPTLNAKSPMRVIGTTLFAHRQLDGYARVPGWMQMRPLESTVEDHTGLPQLPGLPPMDGRPLPFSIEVLFNPSSLTFLNAHRSMRAIDEARWLIAAFLDIPIFYVSAPYAYAILNGANALVRCAAPALSTALETEFSDVSGIKALQPTDNRTYFEQLGVGVQEFRIPHLDALHSAYLGLDASDKLHFLRAGAHLLDYGNPSTGEDFKVMATMMAIEALLQSDRQSAGKKAPVGPWFKNFIASYVAPDSRIAWLYDGLYDARSVIAHGEKRGDVDWPIFGLPNDNYAIRLASWAAAKRGLFEWLLAKTCPKVAAAPP